MIAEPGTIVIETRNDCEVEAGTFEGAIDLKTKTFRAFPAWFNSQRSRLLGEETPSMIAIFLCRRDPLREVDRVSQKRGSGRSLSSAGRHPEIFRNNSGRRETLETGVFCVRPAGYSRIRPFTGCARPATGRSVPADYCRNPSLRESGLALAMMSGPAPSEPAMQNVIGSNGSPRKGARYMSA